MNLLHVDIDRALVEAIALHPARLARIQREITAFDKEHNDDRRRHREWQKGLQKNYVSHLNDQPKLKWYNPLLIPAQLLRWAKWSLSFQEARRQLHNCRTPRENWEPAHITQMRLVHQFYLANRAVVMENEFDCSLGMDMQIVMMLNKRDLDRYEHELIRFRDAAHEMDIAQLRIV